MIFALSFLAGITMVFIILPIDLLVMSFMRYIRFQFDVIERDLVMEMALSILRGSGSQTSLWHIHIFGHLSSWICVRMQSTGFPIMIAGVNRCNFIIPIDFTV